MHELAKTGRWLGGTTPTGYKSEPVEKITVDGKIRKAFKLTLIPEEAELIKVIFNKFIETNSLSKTETFLLQRSIFTKNKRNFTRFAIKNILENPVYMIADNESYNYFKEQNVDLFADHKDFDGKHGIMAYNKTLQKRGKTNEIRDINDWIIAVGKHDGLISGVDWIKVQNQLILNKSKSYRKPRSNVALLSGLLFCGSCNDYMRPKMSQRKNAKGEFLFSYLCSTKEHSKMQLCNIKNPNGNLLDELVCNEVKKLSENPSSFIKKLKECQKTFEQNSNGIETELCRLNKLYNDSENEIKKLISTLTTAGGTAAEQYILNNINELDNKCKSYKENINELQSITKEQRFSDIDFNVLKSILSTFKNTFEDMGLEHKRAVLRILIKKVIWDGENVHIYLFGSDDNYIEFPPFAAQAVTSH